MSIHGKNVQNKTGRTREIEELEEEREIKELEEERRWQQNSAHFGDFKKITTFDPDRIFTRGKRQRLAYF